MLHLIVPIKITTQLPPLTTTAVIKEPGVYYKTQTKGSNSRCYQISAEFESWSPCISTSTLSAADLPKSNPAGLESRNISEAARKGYLIYLVSTALGDDEIGGFAGLCFVRNTFNFLSLVFSSLLDFLSSKN